MIIIRIGFVDKFLFFNKKSGKPFLINSKSSHCAFKETKGSIFYKQCAALERIISNIMSIELSPDLLNRIKTQIYRDETRFSPYAAKSEDALRRDNPGYPQVSDVRTEYMRDTDRILHSRCYTRYIDKTQVFFMFENDHITHRVLHVQLVSKIARTIGKALGLNLDLIEAIALGHDIGHTPFGHDGEAAIDRLCQENNLGHFHHNLQSVIMLDKVENKGIGLNLTLQTLDGILSHNGELLLNLLEPDTKKDWDQFNNEIKHLMSSPTVDIRPMTLEGCVVRFSDIFAYIGRDIEDAITLDLISSSDLPTNCVKVLGINNKEIVSSCVSDTIEHSFGKPYIALSDKAFNAIMEVRRFNYDHIYVSKQLNKHINKNKLYLLFKTVFEYFLPFAYEFKKKGQCGDKVLNKYLQSFKSTAYIQENSTEVIIRDYISGMTDDYLKNILNYILFPTSFGYTIHDRKTPFGYLENY